MVQGIKNSKLNEGPSQKVPEKNTLSKYHQKYKVLPEKTKFTLQYNLKKCVPSSSGIKLKESVKSTKIPVLKKPTSNYKIDHHAVQRETIKTGDTLRSNASGRAGKCVDKVMVKERPRTQEVKTIRSEENSVKMYEKIQRKRSEGKIPFLKLGKKVSFSGISGAYWETRNQAALILQKSMPVDVNPGNGPMKQDSTCNPGNALNRSKIKLKSNDQDVNVEKNVTVDDISGLYDSVDLSRRDEELLSLDKKIWSSLEVEIKETCEKTDFLCDSGDESGDSISDIIQQLFTYREEEDLLQFFATESVSKYSETNWDEMMSVKNLSDPELEKRMQEIENKVSQTVITEKPTSLESKYYEKTTENSFGENNVSQESKCEGTNEKSKMEDSAAQCFSCDVNGFTINENACDSENVNRCAGNKSEKKAIYNNFFNTHKSVAFIGKSIDEKFVTFEPGEVVLYQPYENQMLLYDIANCAATQGYLKMCGIAYDVAIKKNAEQMSPSGKVPFITSNLCIIPDFEAIVSFMQYKKFACLPVNESDKPEFRRIISMIVNVLEMAERYICWYDDTTLLNYTRPRATGHYPFPLNHIMQWKKRREERSRLAESGYCGKSLSAILIEIRSCLQVLSFQLGNNKFFFGKAGTEVDALVYGHVYALLTVQVGGPLKDLQLALKQYPNLISFAHNFDKSNALNKFSLIKQ